jgi:hypothetical protein
VPRTRWVHGQKLLDLKKRINELLLKSFHEIEMKGMLSNTFNEASVTEISKSGKDATTKKRKLHTISLINIDSKILNKILGNQI